MTNSAAKTVLLTLCATAVVGVAAAVGFIYSGLYDVAASTPNSALVGWALHKTSDRSVDARLGSVHVPAGLDKPELIKAGAMLYASNCVVCHGAPGLAATNIALGMNPEPPNLFRLGRDAASDETYWFVRNGVKMSGMPSFGKTRTDEELWSLTAFLKTAPGLSAVDYTSQTASGGAVLLK